MTEYETKTIRYREDGPGSYVIMITRVESPGENEVLNGIGFRSSFFHYVLPEAPLGFATYDPHRLMNELQTDESFKMFLTGMEKDPVLFEMIEDGATYNSGNIP